jgi:hypothetical protein
MGRIYLDMNTCEYFGIQYYDACDGIDVSKDAYRRLMGHKLDGEHMDTLAQHKQIMFIARAASNDPGWYTILSSIA